MMYYILDKSKNVVREPNLMKWAAWMETADRIVRRSDVGGCLISTVFLGMDHQFTGVGPPLLFETMVFPSAQDLLNVFCARYSTWEQAEEGHAQTVREVRAGRIPVKEEA